MEPLRRYTVLADLMDEHGVLEVEPAGDLFERLVVWIINQQLPGAPAAAIGDRVIERVEVTSGGMLSADDETLHAPDLSPQTMEYIRNVVRAFVEDFLSRGSFVGIGEETVIDKPTEIRRIGVWTAKMSLMPRRGARRFL